MEEEQKQQEQEQEQEEEEQDTYMLATAGLALIPVVRNTHYNKTKICPFAFLIQLWYTIGFSLGIMQTWFHKAKFYCLIEYAHLAFLRLWSGKV